MAGSACLVPGPLSGVPAGWGSPPRPSGALLPPHSGPKTRKKSGGLGYSRARGATSARHWQACARVRGAGARAPRGSLPPVHPARARAFFFLLSEGRATRHVVLDCRAHVGGVPLPLPEFRREHVGRVVAEWGEALRPHRSVPGPDRAKGSRFGDLRLAPSFRDGLAELGLGRRRHVKRLGKG